MIRIIIFELINSFLMSPLRTLFILLAIGVCMSVSAQLPCENDTSYLRALIDLKTGTYLGYQGGLYPGGSNNMPYSHYAAGINVSREVMPLGEDGNINLTDGKVGFICLGASTAGNAFNYFKTNADADPTINPCLRIANCAVGAKGLEVMLDTVVNSWYWDDYVMLDVVSSGLTRYQVQVIWIMVTSRVDTILEWPSQPIEVGNKYAQLMPILLAKFPNLKQVYLSGFGYGGYADPTKEFYDMIVEPSSYWNNWSVKFLVENQINGDPALKFTEPDRMSPWVAWGPHLWADGLRANNEDHLRWNCESDYKPDGGGYHLSDRGKDKTGKLIYKFFKDSEVAADWFEYGARWVSCDPDLRTAEVVEQSMKITPNPAGDEALLTLDGFTDGEVQVMICNTAGRLVQQFTTNIHGGLSANYLNLNGLPAGMYYVRVSDSSSLLRTEVFMKQ